MSFHYTGLTSLRNLEIFHKILASAARDTGLANDFEIRGDLKNVGKALDMFGCLSFFMLTRNGMTAHKALLGLIALAIHCVANFRIFANDQVFFSNNKIVGLHAGAVRKNPNELIALTFGLAVAEIQSEEKAETIDMSRTNTASTILIAL